MQIIEKSWGREELIYNGEYCCKLLVYTRSGAYSSLHYHEKKHETFVVTSGTFLVEYALPDGSVEPVVATQGETFIFPPMTKHKITCIRPGVIVESSTQDVPLDCVRLSPSCP